MATRFRSFGRIRRRAEELCVRHGFDPLEEKIELAKCLKSMWLNESIQDATTVEIAALYLKCLDAITPYIYPRLKTIEVEREPAIEGRAPSRRHDQAFTRPDGIFATAPFSSLSSRSPSADRPAWQFWVLAVTYGVSTALALIKPGSGLPWLLLAIASATCLVVALRYRS